MMILALFVKDKRSGKILFQGQTKCGLYPVHPTTNHINKNGPSAFHGEHVPSSIWHSRFGHPSSTVLQHLLSKCGLSQVGSSSAAVCASCQQGKSKKLPFPTSTSRASRPLERVHSDVWGPSPISSISGFRFYVLFVDDFSRYCWLYPLCSKSEVYNVFISFKAQVENLLDNKIKILRSDGGGEYTSHLLKKSLSTCGITHQISCPHTP